MFAPLLFSVIALWFTMFNPQLIEAIPVGSHGVKQLIFAAAAFTIWCMLALSALTPDRDC